jgi:hypothetical protein
MIEKYDLISEIANNIVNTILAVVIIVICVGGPIFMVDCVLGRTTIDDAVYNLATTLGFAIVIAMLFGICSGANGMKMKRLIIKENP